MKTKREMASFLTGLALLINISCYINGQDTKQPESTLTPKKLVAQHFEQWKNEGTSFFELLDEDVSWTVSGGIASLRNISSEN